MPILTPPRPHGAAALPPGPTAEEAAEDLARHLAALRARGDRAAALVARLERGLAWLDADAATAAATVADLPADRATTAHLRREAALKEWVKVRVEVQDLLAWAHDAARRARTAYAALGAAERAETDAREGCCLFDAHGGYDGLWRAVWPVARLAGVDARAPRPRAWPPYWEGPGERRKGGAG